MGGEGLTEATKSALLAANYVAARLNEYFPVLYTGEGGLVAHECILDLRELTAKTGVTAEDVAKRLIDYGFHAPTLAFPVAGTLMVEPTESEDLAEIDRFIDAMITIREEIDQVANGDFTVENSPLRNAPHTASAVVSSDWDRAVPARAGRLPGPPPQAGQVLPARGPHRRRRRGPQPHLLLPAALRIRKLRIPTMTENYTALYEEHKKLGASFTDFGGWQMPLKYSSELAEHHAVRKAAGLFDLSHMGEVWVTGPEAGAFLDYALVGKISAIADGKAKYSLICNADGGIIDDLIVYRLRPRTRSTWWSPTPATPSGRRGPGRTRRGLRRDGGGRLRGNLADRRPGPQGRGDPAQADRRAQHALVTDLKYYAVDEVLTRRRPQRPPGPHRLHRRGRLRALRAERRRRRPVGSTSPKPGEGFGIIPCRPRLPRLAAPGSRHAAVRQRALPRAVTRSTPAWAPLWRCPRKATSWARPRCRHRRPPGAGSKRKLVGLKGLGRRAGRGGYPVLKDGNVVGEVTSGQPSPTLGYPVAMAYVDVEHAELGTALDIDLRGKAEPFEVIALPFYKRQK